ncbi:hypothetical protein SD37_11095 [Amycolatopsis orientalis]|uniref:Major facilitator superfamily (MFS) profile domain-containing protein n=1 Tax=Amycolatopsis orientalis TaxID=31958 RepID=A0A193BVD1_AMYOR|nr:MFS transporter [Amycolatopsis orientalis]ANN16128.1 hypothetical protein SD37_11095 [Amycolatopsis orientalis]
MFTAYRSAFVQRGAMAFCAAGLVSRFYIGIYPLGLLLLLAIPSGQYGKAALVSGCWTIGNAVASPASGMFADRFGQYKTLLISMVAHVALAVMTISSVALDAPILVTLLLALLLGASIVNTGSMVRVRWASMWPGHTAERSAAYSVESVLDEVVFATGPLITAVVAVQVSPYLAVACALLLTVSGVTWLLFQRRTEPPIREAVVRKHRRLAVRCPGMPLLLVAQVAMGATCGAAEVLLVARSNELGHPEGAGIVLACFAIGSGVSGILYGSRHWTAPTSLRFALSASAFGLLPALYLAANSLTALMTCSLINGLTMAPTIINAYQLVDEFVPAPMQTEGFNWFGASLSLGFGGGTAAVGKIADAIGARPTFVVPVVCAFLASTVACLLHMRVAASSTRSVASSRAARRVTAQSS